ncbi:MAG: phosphate acyltransferase PlsX [Peptostreptococcaceae bacterium]|nr:phosphate acyltransferase PlsX [Peptostreptococcaceae bacterium]
MRIAIDAMGGDYAPKEMIKGAMMALEQRKDLELILVGDQNKINEELSSLKVKDPRIHVVDAPEVIGFDEQPTLAIRRKKKSSIVVGLHLVKNKEAEAFVSAGSTGALLAGGLFILGRIEGISRPALTVFVPTPKGDPMLLDVGANADLKAKNLREFAIMGSLYAEKIVGKTDPKVALLNNGSEEGKGSELTKEAYKLISQRPNLNFIGNIEGRDIPDATADVIVTDGFTGNIYIKTAEGVANIIMSTLKQSFLSSVKGKIAALLMKDELKKLKASFNSEEIGGAPFLGVDGVLIKAHGNSNAFAFMNAIFQAQRALEANYIEELKQRVKEISSSDGPEDQDM